MTSRSFQQLRAVFDTYKKISMRDIEKEIETGLSGSFKRAMFAIAKCARNKPAYFAERMYWSQLGLDTDYTTLVRIVITRAEVDMVLIKQEFQKMYEHSLEHFIGGEASGDYRVILNVLIEN